MAKANITEYSATAGSNTEIDGTDISEGCSPATINNAIRELMAHLKDMDVGTTSLTSPSGTNITATTALKTPAIQFTDGDAAIQIANGGGVTANDFSSTSVNIDGGAIDGVTLGTNSAVTQAVIDNININGTTIGHTSDTDLLTLTSGLLTVAGEVSMTTLDIGGTNVTATATEINKLDGVNSTTTELNITDGDTSVGTTAVASGDGIVTNDGGTMRHTNVDTFDTYLSGTTKTLTNKTLTSAVLNTGVSGSAVLDEDDFASNSATKLATQQSIKAYVASVAGNTTAAVAAKDAAVVAQAAAEAALDTFDDRFLGTKSSNPSVDNDGNALADGAIYFDTTNNLMKVYDSGGSQWLQITPSSSNQANINTVAAANSNIATVSTNIANVNTVASNISTISTKATVDDVTALSIALG